MWNRAAIGTRNSERMHSGFPVPNSEFLFHRLRGFVRCDPERSQKAPIVRRDFEHPLRLNDAGRSGNLRERRRLRAIDEANDGFERDFHFEAGGARFFAAGFNLGVFRDRGGNRIGQLPSKPVHGLSVCGSRPASGRRSSPRPAVNR